MNRKKMFCNEPDCDGWPGCSCRRRAPLSKDCNACGTEMLTVLIPARLSHTGRDRWAEKPVDVCIARFVQALNDSGIFTAASCCGHGYDPGEIVLHDGQRITVHSA